jgi:hypothetical protein
MRTSLRNTAEAAHVWAAQTQAQGKAGNVFFDGPVIYSYGRHFAIAKVYKHAETGGNVALFNARRYSVSTSKHQRDARHAWQGNGAAVTAHPDLWPTSDTITQAQLDAITAKQAELDAATNEAEKEAKRERARRNREAAKLAKISQAERLARWQAGENIALDYCAPLALRYIEGGKRIETSKRAAVPTACALLAWRAYQQGTLAPGDRLGPYTVTSTDAESVQIGCHRFPVETLKTFFTA